MSHDSAIVVDGVSKAYRIWESPAARITAPMLASMSRFMPGTSSSWLHARAQSSYRDFWALSNVSFSVRKGEAIGIIGRNGSGKSTLLQIIAGTMQPTDGSVQVTGRVAALLELGSGFNPEFTGRENVYLNAAVLGLTRDQVEAKFDEIERFADIADFIDQPVKTYSSGMQLRLAFAVQTAVEPEVLIVDEALSVGDEAFSRKCIARVNYLRQKGTSLLLVSHSSNLVTTLCDRALLIDRGCLKLVDSPKQVIARYHRLIFTGQDDPSSSPELTPTAERQSDETETQAKLADESVFDPALLHDAIVAYETKGLRISSPRIINSRGDRVNCLSHGLQYTYAYDVDVLEDCYGVVCMCGFRSKEGFELGGLRSHPQGSSFELLGGGTHLSVRFPFTCTFLPETFFLNAGVMGIVDGESTYLHRLVDVVQFKVLPAPEVRAAGLIAFGDQNTVEFMQKEEPR
jgi:lipopolysaccharide transport system ATP-binding protein